MSQVQGPSNTPVQPPAEEAAQEQPKGGLNGKPVEPLVPVAKDGAKTDAPAKSGSSWMGIASWITTAVAVLALAVGVISAAAFMGWFEIPLGAVGVLAGTTAMYAMIAGLGTSVAAGAATAALCCLNQPKDEATNGAEKKGWLSSICGSGQAAAEQTKKDVTVQQAG